MMYYIWYVENGKSRVLTKFIKKHRYALKLKNAWSTNDRSWAKNYVKYCNENFGSGYKILDQKSALKVLGH